MEKLIKHLVLAKNMVTRAKFNIASGSNTGERNIFNSAGEYTINEDGYPVREVMIEIPRGDHVELMIVEEVIGPGHPESGSTEGALEIIPIPVGGIVANGGRLPAGSVLAQQLKGIPTSLITDEIIRSFTNDDGSVNSDPDVTAFAHHEDGKITFVSIDNNTGITTSTTWHGENGEGNKVVTTSTPDNTDSDGFPMGQSSRPITNETEIFSPDGKLLETVTSVTTPTGMTIPAPITPTPTTPTPTPTPTPTRSDSDGDGWDPSDNDGDFSNSTSNGGSGNSLSNSTEEENEHFEP